MHEVSARNDLPHFLGVDDYQGWNAQQWLYPLGSDDAHHHLHAKLSEETIEVLEALEQGEAPHIASELGDQLWCATALAYNVGVSLEEALRNSFVTRQTDTDFSLDRVDAMARKDLSYLDTPGVKALRSVPDPALVQALKSGDRGMAQEVFGELSKHLCHYATLYRELQRLPDDMIANNLSLRQWSNVARAAVREELAELLVLTSLVAQSQLGTTLVSIMDNTWRKHKARVEAGIRITTDPK